MRKIILFVTIFFTINAKGFAANLSDTLLSAKGGWGVILTENGAIATLEMTFGNKRMQVPWRTDEYGGPAWKGITLHRVQGKKYFFEGRKNKQVYSLEYVDSDGKLTIITAITNNSQQLFFDSTTTSLRLGIDNQMKDPSNYFGRFFPTLLRCEKTHFWGYFQNPNGQIISIVSPDAIASRTIEYISLGHRIATTSLDMLHQLPLPARHPQQLTAIAAGKTKKWTIVLQPVSSLNDVLQAVATNSKAPSIAMDRTTAAPGETIGITIHTAKGGTPRLAIYNPAGKTIKVPAPQIVNGMVLYNLPAPASPGNYKIIATLNGKQTEAIFNIRKPWGWYLQQARAEALRMQIKPMQHREGWLSFFSAYAAQVHFPNKKLIDTTEQLFAQFYKLMVDSAQNDFYKNKPTWHSRPQNTSWMVGLLTTRYAATKKINDLELAAKWADHFIKKFQLPNGTFKGYTALTMGTKFLRELIVYEKPLAIKSVRWKERYNRHLLSIERASQNLLLVKDLEDTEGEATYEDTQAGSAWSLLAMEALLATDNTLKNNYLQASLQVQQHHECLTQALIPDGRMRGGTLRFWEAQYDILMIPNMMNSPHGWTMRSQFGAFYLYLLTGEERFLNIMNNAMGACVQAIDENSGVLRWAFVPDPYIAAQQFVPDIEKPGKGKHIPVVVGEQWLPMISDWWRVPDGEIGALTNFRTDTFQQVTQGWSCDNDVHETFRVLADQFVTNAFVLERADGSLRTMNCKAVRKGNKIFIRLPEKVVCRVHLNFKNKNTVVIPFANETCRKSVDSGMHWVGPGGVSGLLGMNN